MQDHDSPDSANLLSGTGTQRQLSEIHRTLSAIDRRQRRADKSSQGNWRNAAWLCVGGLLSYGSGSWLLPAANKSQAPLGPTYAVFATSVNGAVERSVAAFKASQELLPKFAQLDFRSPQGELISQLSTMYRATVELGNSELALADFYESLGRDLVQQEQAHVTSLPQQISLGLKLTRDLTSSQECVEQMRTRQETLQTGLRALSTAQERADALVRSVRDVIDLVHGKNQAFACLQQTEAVAKDMAQAVALHDVGAREFNSIAAMQGRLQHLLSAVAAILVYANGGAAGAWLKRAWGDLKTGLRHWRSTAAKKSIDTTSA